MASACFRIPVPRAEPVQPFLLPAHLGRYVISNLWSMVVSCPDGLDARVRWFAYSALLDRARISTVVFLVGTAAFENLSSHLHRDG